MKDITPILPLKHRNRLRGSSDPFQALSEIRASVGIAGYRALVQFLPSVVRSGRGVLPPAYPRLSELKRHQRSLAALPLESEVQWASQYLLPHAGRLAQFINASRQFNHTLLHGDFNGCAEVLGKVEQDLGFSFWSIENRLALLQTSSGLEAQKLFAQEVRERGSSFVAAVTYYISQRNEQTTNTERFREQIKELAGQWALSSDATSYLLYRILNDIPDSSVGMADVLRFELGSSVCDYYETFIRLAAFSAARQLKVRQCFTPALELLAPHLNDIRMQKLLFLLTVRGHYLEAATSEAVKFFDAAAASDRLDSMNEDTITDDPEQVHILFRSVSLNPRTAPERVANNPFMSRVAAIASRLVRKDSDVHDASVDAARMISNFRYSWFAAEFQVFTLSELSSKPHVPDEVALSAFIDSPYVSQMALAHMPQDVRKVYGVDLLRRYGQTASIVGELYRAGLNVCNEPALSSFRGHFAPAYTVVAAMERAMLANDYATALTLAQSLHIQSDSAHGRYIFRTEAFCYLQLQRLESAIDIIARGYVRDSGSIWLMPIKECAYRLNKETRRQLSGVLSVPIVLDLFYRFVDDSLASIRSYAYEDFLLANGMERPSQLKPIFPKFDTSLLVYYLRYLCVPEVMYVSSAFHGSKDLQDERLQVCALLTELDEAHIKDYESEIRELTRRQIVERGVRQVEQTKIFVDAIALGRWAERNLKDSFVRYQALLRAGMDAGASGFNEAVHKVLAGENIPQRFLELPKNEATDLLVAMVVTFLDECMTHPQYGLDCYLSMRIRHGVLSGQLRGPLEEHRIITQREGGSNEYKSNEYWMARLEYLDPYLCGEIDARLAEFSKSYDTLIDNVARDNIQVYDPKNKNKGLFKLSFSLFLIRSIAASVKADTSFDRFLELCLEVFWEEVGRCLQNMRKFIDNDVKSGLNDLFLQLEIDIERLAPNVVDLNRSIRFAQTGAQQALEQVKDWFQLPKPLLEPELSFEHFA